MPREEGEPRPLKKKNERVRKWGGGGRKHDGREGGWMGKAWADCIRTEARATAHSAHEESAYALGGIKQNKETSAPPEETERALKEEKGVILLHAGGTCTRDNTSDHYPSPKSAYS